MNRLLLIYCVVFAGLCLTNAVPEERLSKVTADPVLTVGTIPSDYLEKHFAGGGVPNGFRELEVEVFVLQVRRGWPACYQNDYGYCYRILGAPENTATELRGFPNIDRPWTHRVRWPILVANIIGLVSLLAFIHALLVNSWMKLRERHEPTAFGMSIT